MSENEKADDTLNLNTNNANKTVPNAIAEVVARNDDASTSNHEHEMADVEEIKCSDEPESDLIQPDVYIPPNSNNKTEYERDIDKDDKIDKDKWVITSPRKVQKSIGAGESSESNGEESDMSSEAQLKVELPPLKNKELPEAVSSNDTALSNSLKPDRTKPENSAPDISDAGRSADLKVKLPPQIKEATEEEKVDGATSNVEKYEEKPEKENEESMDESLESLEGVYQIKWVKFKGKEIPIITQNENGPCPLLAIMNVLLLKGKVKFTSDTEIISSEQMMAYLGECILANKPQNVTEVVQLNYEQNMHDAMAVIHKLQTGLDVNVRFNGVSEFEYTPECIIFDLLGISLYHGWLVDPQNHAEVTAIGSCSYNQLVEKIILQRSSENNDLVTEALVAEGFLDRTASQLTYHGLCELSSTVKPDQLCVFFRNNHFCTLFRHKDELFLLVTDQGFLHERNVVWETLNNVEGDHYFVDSEFHTYTKPAPQEPVLPPEVPVNSDEQVNHDYLLAMSLQQEQQLSAEQMEIEASQPKGYQRTQMSDAELAARLQAEENAQAAQHAAQQPAHHHANHRQSHGGNHGQQRSRERERSGNRERQGDRSKDKDKDKDGCCIL